MSSTKKHWAKAKNLSPFKNKINFEQLVFREPFTETSKDTRLQGKKVFFTGVANKAGVIICKHTDSLGFIKHKIVSINHCMRSSAMRIYELAKERGATNILFYFIQAPISCHSKLLQDLKNQYNKIPLDLHYEKLLPWLKKINMDCPPLELFNFRPVFIQKTFGKQWSFLDYDKRSGVYIIRKKIKEEKRVVHVGQSIKRMSQVLRNHFYPNKHVSYYLDVHLGIYDVAIIEVQPSLFRKFDTFLKKVTALEELLKRFYLNGKDQLQEDFKIEFDTACSYKPIYKEKDDPFPVYRTAP